MKQSIVINSQFEVLSRFDESKYDTMVVKNEPMLFNCDLLHAKGLGGNMTRDILKLLPEDWKEVPLVIDSRVHMLMPGWFPCIPGWHHDDVPRTRADGQPNYLDPDRNRSEHIIALVNGDICPTAIATGMGIFTVPEGVVYEKWHKDVEFGVKQGTLEKTYLPSGALVRITDDTWHTGTPAVASGWRFFIRISRYYDSKGNPIARGNERTNEERRQVQVYMNNPNAGW